MDSACSTCHDGAIHQEKQAFTPSCASCHAEHRGRTVQPVLDAACVQCHSKTVTGFGEGEHPEFAPLRGWLTDRIYRHGRKFTAPEIVQRATGEPLSIAPYLGYLNTKYGAIYEL